MPKFIFDFNLSVWVQNVEVEADNYEEAVEKLGRMTAYDIVDEGYVKNSDITDLDYEVEDEDDED